MNNATLKNKLIELTNEGEDNTEELREYLKYGGKKTQNVDDLEFEHIERHGGCEGGGDEHWVVFSVIDGEKKTFWEVPGWYASHNGAHLNWDELYQVIPKEKTVTVWEAV